MTINDTNVIELQLSKTFKIQKEGFWVIDEDRVQQNVIKGKYFLS